jgi:predicted DNA-binding transcriptional regulator AlpA
MEFRKGCTVTEPLILDAIAAAELLGISERAFHYARRKQSFPKPIDVFGPRRPRWRRADLVAWVESRPELEPQSEPSRLRLARDSRGVDQ